MSLNNKHIVVIEDDPVLRELTQMAFTLEGAQVDMCENGEQGIAYLQQHLESVDLILLDLFMPVLDGVHVLNWLREEQSSKVNVVVMTAMVDAQTEQNMLAAGANKIIKKPLDIKMLLTTTRELLGS